MARQQYAAHCACAHLFRLDVKRLFVLARARDLGGVMNHPLNVRLGFAQIKLAPSRLESTLVFILAWSRYLRGGGDVEQGRGQRHGGERERDGEREREREIEREIDREG